jgi:hypothetical protein
VWPQAFLLFSGLRDDVGAQGLGKAAEILAKVGHPIGPLQELGPPVALRWVTQPVVGFPRVPFEVWRRPRIEKPPERLFERATVTAGAQTVVGWTAGELYEVHFDAKPDPGATLVVEALDLHGRVIPGQRAQFTVAARGGLRSPGIASLRLTGRGAVETPRGTLQQTLANEPDWTRIEVVGLPFRKGEIAPPVYTPTPQGPGAPGLDGFEAALVRLRISEVLHQPLPATGVADIPTPMWNAPDPAAYLKTVRDFSPALVALIADCLSSSDDTNMAKLQVLYQAAASLPGIRQADLPGAAIGADPTQVEVPVVGISMLAAGSDTDAATALGYGTVDFPPDVKLGDADVVYPPGTVRTAFDYMVTAPFVFPFVGKVEIAALSQARAMPVPTAALQAARRQGNRAPGRDQAATESVQVSWQMADLPQGYGVLLSRRPADSAILNAPRVIAGGFDPFIPLTPDPVDGAAPIGARASFTDAVVDVPIGGSATSRYMVIGRDVFGRWSAWRLVAYTATAPPVQMPGLLSARLSTDVASRVGRVVPATLEIEFAWDWSDRSPHRVVLFATFFNASSPTAPASPATGFPVTPPGPVVVRFGSGGGPFIDSGQAGSVVVVPSSPPDPERRRYRLTLQNVSCDFSSVGEVALAVWARGAELVRPTVLSDAAGPRVARAPDPIPPDPPSLPPIELLWTALPDATGRARVVLRWPSVPNATGYIVWEATETAVRHAVNPGATPPAPGTTIVARAGALRSLITATADSQLRSMIAFSRLRERPIAATELELELSGAADTLYAYRVSAITAANVESSRSPAIALVAVPHRNVPGQPRLLLRTTAGPGGGIDVIVLPGKGPPTAGFRVHRVRRSSLATAVGMMGPAVIEAAAAGWRNVDVPRGARTLETDAGRAILDPVSESWYAYHYRVVAIGAADPPQGGLPGESAPSAMASAVVPPATEPLLDTITGTVDTGATNRVITFRTDLPIRESPLGRAEIAILSVAPGASGRLERTPVLRVQPDRVPQGGPFLAIESPTAAQLAAMPEIVRSAPDTQGRCTYSARMRGVADGAIVVTDPLARSTERPLPEIP